MPRSGHASAWYHPGEFIKAERRRGTRKKTPPSFLPRFVFPPFSSIMSDLDRLSTSDDLPVFTKNSRRENKRPRRCVHTQHLSPRRYRSGVHTQAHLQRECFSKRRPLSTRHHRHEADCLRFPRATESRADQWFRSPERTSPSRRGPKEAGKAQPVNNPSDSLPLRVCHPSFFLSA